MKNLMLFALAFVSVQLSATNYYFANAGNDNNAGTAANTAWQSLSKLKNITLAPGDSILLNRGDLFRGSIIINQSGSNSAPIVIASYGAGKKPVISGSAIVNNWTKVGKYYTASYTGLVYNFFVNGKEQTLARYPNEHDYLTLDSGQTMYLYDNALPGLNSNLINGSKICVHSSQWSWEKTDVASFAGSKISFAKPMIKQLNNYGYFLYDNINHLDTAGEWKFDSAGQTIYYIPEGNLDPNNLNCEISIFQNGIELRQNVSNISIIGIDIRNQANAGVQAGYGTIQEVQIKDCYFSGQYNYGVNYMGKYAHVHHSYFREIDGMAVFISGKNSGYSKVNDNTFRSIGITRASGLGGQVNGTALMCASDSNYFHHNSVDSTGYCGISADGAYNIVERNMIDHAMLIENDGGAIKGWESITHHSICRNNFIAHSDGCTEGTYKATFVTPAIYFDFNVNNCIISNNTVYNHTQKGIFQNSANRNHTIEYNVIYGSNCMLDLNGSSLAPNAVPIAGYTIKHNSFFAKNKSDVIIRQVDYSNNYNYGTFDSNYYFQPYTSDHYILRMNGFNPVYHDFAWWQNTSNDPHSRSSFVQWTYPTSYDTLIMNQTDNVVTVNLGGTQYLDLDSHIVCGSITLQPYTSQILINTQTQCPTAGIITTPDYHTLTIFPNPTNSEFRIYNPENIQLSNYIITDLYGRTITTGKLLSNYETVNIESFASGLYFITFNGSTTYQARIVKE